MKKQLLDGAILSNQDFLASPALAGHRFGIG
jgi:hypothetical protein